MKKCVTRIIALLMLLVMAGCICLVPELDAMAATTPLAKHGRLSVKGADIVDKNGEKFQLRGISTHGINWDVGYPYVNRAAFKTLRDDWGVNAIRLAMYTKEYNGYCNGGDRAQLEKLIDDGVSYAKSLGMYAIIDWHVLNENPNNNLQESKEFFAKMAKKYKGNTNVIYEICNEPNNCTWDEIKSYANQVIRVIRKYDKKAIIIVGTPTWSQLGRDGTSNEVADNPFTTRKNIVYALHFYAGEWAHNEYLPAKVEYARSKKVPIIVSEFGVSPASGDGAINTASADNWFKLLDKYNISYFCWSLSNKAESASLLAPGGSKTSKWSTGDLSETGRYIRKKYRLRRKKLGNKA